MRNLFAFLMASLLLTTSGFAQTGGTTGLLAWSLSDEGTLTVSGTGVMPDYDLSSSSITPSEWAPWHSLSDQIIRVVIEEGVTNIGNNAFSFCENLISVSLPEGLESIGDFAFYFCRSLTAVNFPRTLESVGANAFRTTSLTSVKIPARLTNIGSSAFEYGRYSAIEVDEANPSYFSEADVLYNKDKSVLMVYPSPKAGDTFVVPQSVETISGYAFAGSPLSSINIHPGVKTIGDGAFSDCRNLQSITLPPDARIGSWEIFQGTGITSFIIPEEWTMIGSHAFASSALSTITIHKEVNTIGKAAFYHCDLLFSIELPENLKFIEDRAFMESAIESIVIPEGVETIGEYAFAYCLGLRSIKIPLSVWSIGSHAFFKSPNVEVYWDTPIAIQDEAFGEGINDKEPIQKAQKTLTVPSGTKELYEQAPGWRNFATIIERAPTAISPADNENIIVTSVPKGICIETKETLPVAVYNLFGQRIHQTILNGNTIIPMETGIYIVKANGKGMKLVVK